MKYHYRRGVVGWSLAKVFDLLAIAGWILLIVLIIDTMILNGELTTKVLMR